jgi:tetratricopeptide (TPR) repeat protein
VRDATDLLLNQVMDKADLMSFAGEGRRNTDDDPAIEFSAPRGLFLGPEENARIYGLLEAGGRAVVPPLQNEPGLEEGAGPKERADTYVRLAAALRRKSMLTRAERLLREAIGLDGGLAEAQAGLGEVLYSQGKREEGERLLLRSLEMDPGLKQPYAVLGFLNHERRDLPKARTMFDELTRRFPDEAMGYYGQALVDAEEQDWERSRERLKRALALKPDFGLARQLLTLVEGKLR